MWERAPKRSPISAPVAIRLPHATTSDNKASPKASACSSQLPRCNKHQSSPASTATSQSKPKRTPPTQPPQQTRPAPSPRTLSPAELASCVSHRDTLCRIRARRAAPRAPAKVQPRGCRPLRHNHPHPTRQPHAAYCGAAVRPRHQCTPAGPPAPGSGLRRPVTGAR